MELRTLYQDLKNIYQNDQTDFIFGFDFAHSENEIELLINLYNKGFWYMIPFGYDQSNVVGLRIIPGEEDILYPVIKYFKFGNYATTFSPNIESSIVMGNLELMDNYDVIEELIEDLDVFSKKASPFLNYLNKTDIVDFYKSYLTSGSKKEVLQNAKDNYDRIYTDFWKNYHVSKEESLKVEILRLMIKDSSYLPKMEGNNYGIWNTMLYKCIAKRAAYMDRFENQWKYLWEGVKQPLGIDNAPLSIDDQRPTLNNALSSDLIYHYFNTESEAFKDFFPREVQEHALFNATEAIRVKGSSYVGEDHLIAAAIMDEQYNDPIGAWNSLITASHFAGINNAKELIPSYWKAAIHLSEKHNWKEIHEVLVQQYEYYNFYKDKV